jgi:hypothetical protein
MIMIRKEAEDIIIGKQPRDNNLLKNAPHPTHVVALSDQEWKRPYTRFDAVYPVPTLLQRKFWPTISRIDDAYGDLNLIVRGITFLVAVHSLTESLVRLPLSGGDGVPALDTLIITNALFP